jgi:hypothetical protein
MMSREYKQSSDAKHLQTINSLSSQAFLRCALPSHDPSEGTLPAARAASGNTCGREQ